MTVENPHLESARATLAAWAADAELEPAVSELFECHIFCAPLNPDDAVKAQFVEACEALGIKGLCLGLDFAGAGMVDVLATKKFRTHERPGPAIQAMLRSAEALSESFEVIRLKLEVRARPESGVPSTDEEMRQLNQRTGLDHYFEFHLKLARHAVTPESDRRLKALGAELARRLQTRVPFSCQSLGSKDRRFLSTRTYGLGLEASRGVVESIVDALRAQGHEVSQVQEEMIVFDTNRALDAGWLEPRSAAPA